ncbi:S-methyl-5'-thioadenosine phosphorylase [Fervidicoccus fontis]|uniref:S-methyl-5'-thioadenosine phosphorylase n=1 Tax=Fervidicoccus fontis TaxID=683846 RepID=A0A2J6N4L5_9CREN|nr:S-methyl-5'-thioadenosine phosphorylase [Fervidicoccus fontis]PMB75385.1 MAG: 5'-methylthioadenosine phosphorylase [Fervidicoccus fontis]PMB75514.1 MAG: 5'-methylthioadenosine phosphorylase [Fervidicoccus fontis]PMB76277.1 MAG: 5'-methylthioadenosine phosphorylase [Fervidicoccus fontis]PMB78069.1 MAG: 5'-methylthioadenosine phosphorylase [Fervidicoccus fontis]
MKEKADIAIIGGSGLYSAEFLEDAKELLINTPYGAPSDAFTIGTLKGKKVAFLPRHGKGHRIPPHKINYRANIWAIKQLGAKWVLSVSAVGSLRTDVKPGDFIVPDQFIDFTKSREYTFFDGPRVAHVSMAYPFCESLRRKVVETARKLNINIHTKGTYVCIEGPRFSTFAESRIWKEVFKADIVGMTLVPEVNLACEMELCYATLAMITDYDVWAERPVTADEVERVMSENVKKAREILYNLIPELPENPEENGGCSCCRSLNTALL